MKIFQAIASVMGEIGVIGKNKKNQQQGFMFRGIDDVMNALHPALIKHNVFIVPEVLDVSREERATKSGGAMTVSVYKIKYTFYTDDGSSVSATTIGEAMDSGDKGSNKAMAIAFKYACFQVFCIPTEEMADPDADSPELGKAKEGSGLASKSESEPVITKEQAVKILSISGGNKQLCQTVCKKYGYKSSSEIKASDYERICEEIAAKVKQAA